MKRKKMSKLLMACVLVGVTFLLSGCTDLTAGQVTVTRTGSIMGTILDSGGQLILGVDVSVGSRTDTTDNNGGYFLENLPIGEYVLVARKVGYNDVRQNIIVVEGNSVIGDIIMEREGESGGNTGYTPPVNNEPIDDDDHALYGFTPMAWSHRTDAEYPIYFNNVAYKDTGSTVLLGVEYETSTDVTPANFISCFNPPNGTAFMLINQGGLKPGINTVIFEVRKTELAELRADHSASQRITILFSPLGHDTNRSFVGLELEQLPL